MAMALEGVRCLDECGLCYFGGGGDNQEAMGRTL